MYWNLQKKYKNDNKYKIILTYHQRMILFFLWKYCLFLHEIILMQSRRNRYHWKYCYCHPNYLSTADSMVTITRRGTIGECDCRRGGCRKCGSKCRRCKCSCDGISPLDALERFRGRPQINNNVSPKTKPTRKWDNDTEKKPAQKKANQNTNKKEYNTRLISSDI